MTSTLGHPLARPVEEVLYRSDRTSVRRVVLDDGGTVIHKEPLGANAEQRRRHETAILGRLAGVPGVAQVAAGVAGPEVIVLADIAGRPLRDLAPLAGPALVDLAVRLATVVAAVHRQGVVHKDISPANVIVTEDGCPTLIDFELATTFAEERPSFVHQSQIAGTLAYIAPEQTGRTGGAADQRADLYSLGATLYELATGRPPFAGEEDPLRLIHSHLAVVPAAPSAVNADIPAMFSEIILRLLEKEPDRRYQSADGLAYDLERLASGEVAGLTLGERDFPLRLLPPTRLVGRNAEIAALRDAFDAAVRGDGGAVLVSGAPGVGKTALIDELRPLATARGGWFVSGKFDQNRADVTSDAVTQAMRGVCRLLLAEPEASLAGLREGIAAALGGNAGLVASVLPELGVLLDVAPVDAAGDEARLSQGGLQLLRAVVTPERPLVMVVDDLQWSSATPIGFLDLVLRDKELAGLLVVGIYRDAEVDAAHPWSAMLARWDRLGCAPPRLHLGNLPLTDLGDLLAEMLRLPADEAGRLAEAVAARTAGNPYDSVELVNALRRHGVLTPGPSGWTWDGAALRAFVSEGDVVDLLAARMSGLPAATQSLLDVMAGLAGEVGVAMLGVAAAAPDAAALLVPALEDGLLVHERQAGEDTVRFRHDRVQQAAFGRLDRERRGELQLASARRLAEHPAYAVAAAEQYLAAADRVAEPAECRRAAALFRAAAARAHLINYAAAEQFLAASVRLLPADDPLQAEVQAEWHAALYALGRLAEADEVYAAVERRALDPLVLAPSACVQISSLTGRGRTHEVLTLGAGLLSRLGLRVPPAEDLPAAVEQGLDALLDWAGETDPQADRGRAEIVDPAMVAAANLVNRMMPAAFFSDEAMLGWLVTEARRLWEEHGPHAALVCPIAHAGLVMVPAREDYRTGYRAIRRVLAAGEERGYEPETSQARFLFSVSAGHWFEPLEDDIQQARQAHEGLVRAGDLLFACFAFHSSTPSMLDTAGTLDGYRAEVEAGLTFAARTGNEQVGACSLPFQRLVDMLRDGSGGATAVFDDPGYLAAVEGHPMATAYHHIVRAQAAAMFGEQEALDRHSAAAMAMLHFVEATYSTARAYLLRALALAERVRDGDPDAAAQLDVCREWLARRAADAPATFGHLVRLVDAERAWAGGATQEAAAAFDAALDEVADRRRPVHQAMIAERAAAFHLDAGTRHTGRSLLAEALRVYQAWGATAKVRQLTTAYPFLRGADAGVGRGDPATTTRVSVDSIDLIAVLKASQVLSSETSLDRLRTRVVEVLRTLTGASIVRMLLRGETTGWHLYDDDTATTTPVAEAGERGLLALSAFRYAERTRAALLVEDATRDDRFARDPYVASLDRCSLLAVPILSQGDVRAMVLLENRLSSNVFTADRLDAVLLIAGQLAVSLDNARLYTSLEHKVAERTRDLEDANRQLQQLSITDPLTGLANRRRLADLLAAEWQRGLRTGHRVAVAMIDVDLFKLFNDHYGHLAGDACLRKVAGAAADTARGDNLVARYGGEEFAVVLPGEDVPAARRAAERIRAAVEALTEPHAKSPIGHVTVSIGVASAIPTPDGTPEQLIEAADVQLYQAKRDGRNRVA